MMIKEEKPPGALDPAVVLSPLRVQSTQYITAMYTVRYKFKRGKFWELVIYRTFHMFAIIILINAWNGPFSSFNHPILAWLTKSMIKYFDHSEKKLTPLKSLYFSELISVKILAKQTKTAETCLHFTFDYLNLVFGRLGLSSPIKSHLSKPVSIFILALVEEIFMPLYPY